MASKNEKQAKASTPQQDRKRGRNVMAEEIGRSRGDTPTGEDAPRTRNQRRAEAGSGSEASGQGPSGSETAGASRAGRSTGQGEKRDQTLTKKGSLKNSGTGGSQTQYGRKR